MSSFRLTSANPRSSTSAPLLVTAHEDDGGGLRIRVTGSLPNDQVGHFRDLVDAALHDGPEPLVVDLAALTDWGHEAQEMLLHLVRTQRNTGRSVVVQGLQGRAAQDADESGMGHLLSSPAGGDSVPFAPVTGEHNGELAPGSTLGRIKADRHSRRPTIHATCQFGHAAALGGDRCDHGHLMLPL